VQKHVEKDFGIAVFVESLATGFSVDGGGEKAVFGFELGLNPHGEGLAKLGEGEFGKGPGDAGGTGTFGPSESEGFTEPIPVGVGPSNEDGHFVDSGEETEKNEGAEGVKGKADTACGTGIGKLLKDSGQFGQLMGVHDFLLEIGGVKDTSPLPTNVQTELFNKNDLAILV
jgi:hypothetical protein